MTPGEAAPAAGPSNQESLDGEVRLAVYRHFLEEGRAPTPAELADSLEHPFEEVEAALLRLAEAHILVLEPGSTAIRMAMPFSNVRTGFRVEVPFLSWYANCAWDALGIPALLRGAGRLPSQSPQRITTACPDCDETITLHLAGLEGPPILFSPTPQGPPAPPPVVHFVVPAAHWWSDILHT
jgi:hypothetical protein